MKRTISILIALSMLLSVLSIGACADTTEEDTCPSAAYTDVPEEGNWAHEGIDFVIANGIMEGTGENIFSPDASVTRGMIVTILYRMDGQTGAYSNDFTDVSDDAWYANAVGWAEINGIVYGYGDGEFGPDDVLTREQMAVIIYRYVTTMTDYVLEESDNGTDGDALDSVTDPGEISNWAREAVIWALDNGILNGTQTSGATTVSPAGTATRAQIAAIIMRVCELLEAYKEMNLNIENAASIVLKSGNTGTEIEITEADIIEEITVHFNSLTFRKDGEVDSDGWTYWLKWYDADGNLISDIVVLSSDKIAYGDYYYTAEDGVIDTDLLDALLA